MEFLRCLFTHGLIKLLQLSQERYTRSHDGNDKCWVCRTAVFSECLSMTLILSLYPLYRLQISPLRPQRPKSQVINIAGEKRLSVSPGPPAPQTASSAPPITPRVKLSFSTLSSSSM